MSIQSTFKRLSVIACVTTCILETSYAQLASIENKAEALLNEVISFQESVGISAGILKDGEVIWIGAAGYLDVENRVAFNTETLNRTASIAKPMTAIAILQLHEQNKLHIDDPIQKYLPSFPNNSEENITIRHLLHHSSGVGAYQSENEASPTTNYKSLEDAINVFKNRPLHFKPGTDYQYTTYGYVILGAIVEKASGMTFRNFMKKNIWSTANMQHTDVEIFGSEYPNKSKLYYKRPNREIVPDMVTNLSVKVPGGGFYSTAGDLLRFGQSVLTNKLIKPETFDLMMTNPGTKSRGNPYLMGWFQYGDENSRNGRVIGHSGSQSGTSTQLMIYLEQKVVVVVLSNTSGVWNNIFDLTNKLGENAIDPEVLKQPLPEVISVPDSILDNYAGSYQSESGSIRRIQKTDGYLSIFSNNNSSYRLYPTSKDTFFIRRGDITIEFVRNNEKNSIDLVINDFGETYIYYRM